MPIDFDRFPSLPAAFIDRVRTAPNAPIWMYPEGTGESRRWREVAAKEAASSVYSIASYLRSLGVTKGTKVAIMANSRPEWIVSDFGILCNGGVTVSVYPSLTATDAGFILYDSGSRIVFAENQEQVDKLLSLLETPCLIPEREVGPEARVLLEFDKIIAFERVTAHPLVIQLSEVLKTTVETPPDTVGTVSREDVASLVYTSGTTGPPKGVIQTHGNHLSNLRQSAESRIFGESEPLFLFLPLAHAFARLAGYVGTITHSGLRMPGVYNTTSSKLDLQLVMKDIAEGGAAIVPSVPRLFEKIKSGLEASAQKRGLSQFMLRHCLKASLEQYRATKEKRSPSLMTQIVYSATDFIRKKIKRKLFGETFQHAISGGAKLPVEVHEFFEALSIHIYEGYGLTETCVATHVNLPGKKKIGSVGPAFRGIEVRVADDGEILIRGPNVAKGYLNRPKATAEAWDQEGWFHTGDIGRVDEDGFLFITDRKKDLIITAGGKNVAPQILEGYFKKAPGVSQVVIVGEGRPYLVALVSVDQAVLKELKEAGTAEISSEKPTDESVKRYIEKGIQELNRTLPSYEQIKKIAILPEDLTIDNGLLTPTQKPRRRAVMEKYRELVENLYS